MHNSLEVNESRVKDKAHPAANACLQEVSCANHSCDPNAEVRLEIGTTQLRLVARRAIASGEEVTISYIDENDTVGVKERRDALQDYGFVCGCEKCAREEGSAVKKTAGGHKRKKGSQ